LNIDNRSSKWQYKAAGQIISSPTITSEFAFVVLAEIQHTPSIEMMAISRLCGQRMEFFFGVLMFALQGSLHQLQQKKESMLVQTMDISMDFR
jgi:hypothetical protein